MVFKNLLAIAVIAVSAAFCAADETAPQASKSTADQLAQAKEMVQRVLNHWDFKTWDQLLAADVTVKFKLGTIGVDALGGPAALGALVEVHGRDEAKRALRQVYGDLKKTVRITGQIAYGYDVILLGELNVTKQQDKPESLPIACFMKFNSDGKVEDLAVAGIDTRPFFQAVSDAAQAANKASDQN
jgi:hypothetical protein